MDKAVISFDEQETVLIIGPAQAGNRINIYSCIPADVRYYRKLVTDNPDDANLIREDNYGIEVEIPSSWFRRPKPQHKRQLTEEQKAAVSARLQLAREKRNQ